MNWRRVVRDTLIVWFATALGGAVVGFCFALLGAMESPKLSVAIGFTNVVFSLVAFSIVAVLAKEGRLRHLAIVALASWVLGLVNVAFFGVTFWRWLLSIFVLAIFALIGGTIAWLITFLTRASSQEGAA